MFAYRQRIDSSGFMENLLPVEYVIFKYAIKSSEPIFPTDFFSFGISTSIIGNAHFIDPNFWNTAYFSCYLRFKTETVFFQVYTFYIF
jgi:hypothetical protein